MIVIVVFVVHHHLDITYMDYFVILNHILLVDYSANYAYIWNCCYLPCRADILPSKLVSAAMQSNFWLGSKSSLFDIC